MLSRNNLVLISSEQKRQAHVTQPTSIVSIFFILGSHYFLNVRTIQIRTIQLIQLAIKPDSHGARYCGWMGTSPHRRRIMGRVYTYVHHLCPSKRKSLLCGAQLSVVDRSRKSAEPRTVGSQLKIIRGRNPGGAQSKPRAKPSLT